MEAYTWEPSPSPLLVGAAYGSLLLPPRPGCLHLWTDGRPARGPAVQQRHPEAELVLRPSEAWLKDPGAEEEELVQGGMSQRTLAIAVAQPLT